MADEQEIDPKAPDWYRQELARLRDRTRAAEQEAAARLTAEAAARTAAEAARKAAEEQAAKVQADLARVNARFAMHREGLISDRHQRQMLRDYEDMRSELGDKAPAFEAWLTEQKKDPDVAVFFRSQAPAAAAPAPAGVQPPAPAPAAPSVDRGVVERPAVLAKDKDTEVVEKFRRGELTGPALAAALKEMGVSEERAKVLSRA